MSAVYAEGPWAPVEHVPNADGWAIRTRLTGHKVLEFEAYVLLAGTEGFNYEDGPQGWTRDINEADPAVAGWIRWDGCCSLTVGRDAPGPAWHHDELADLDRLLVVLRYCHTLAAERIDGYIGEAPEDRG